MGFLACRAEAPPQARRRETSRQLADMIGSKAADLVADLIRQQHEEAPRRVHEDIAGVELRLTAAIADSERRMGARITESERSTFSELGLIRREAAANKQELSDRIAGHSKELADRHSSTLRWLVTLLVVQSVFLLATKFLV